MRVLGTKIIQTLGNFDLGLDHGGDGNEDGDDVMEENSLEDK